MSKHVKTLSAIGSAIAGWSNTVAANEATRKTLLAQCEKLSLVEKQKIDAELVGYYALQAGVGVRTVEKAYKPYMCLMQAVWKRNDKKQVDHPAAMALSRARSVLFAKEKGPAHTRSGNATTSAKPLDFDTLLPVVGGFVEKFAAETVKLNAQQKKDVRHTIMLLQGLLA